MTVKSNFWKLINKYDIEIPKIQRDYAQGRNNEKVRNVRKNFINNIYEAIKEEKELNLDFIYGSIKKFNRTRSIYPIRWTAKTYNTLFTPLVCVYNVR